MSRPPVPPFTIETATQKVRLAIAVRFTYDCHNAGGQWFRSYGNENWAFDAEGLMHTRIASINDLAMAEPERKYYWPPGRRPDDHPGLTELGL